MKTIVVTDEPEKYKGVTLAEGVTVHHRDELDALQRQFREIKGTTVIIYDQTCATEKRRRRKRGTLIDPAARVVINELVCEGCGDCSVQSNCMSVEPLETEFGRKRQINQSTCNKDFSCVKGFCPSFVTVEGGHLKKKAKGDQKLSPFDGGTLPEPSIPMLGADHPVWGIVVAGVGGTGVITIGQLLGMAAHIEGKGIVTQDAAGLAQKGGSTWSHVLISAKPGDICTTRVGTASADLIIGCDPIVTANKETMMRMQLGKTHVALNAHAAPTASFVHNGAWQNPGVACQAEIVKAVGLGSVGSFNADAAATKLMGDSIYTNPMLLGYAWQKGWVPLGLESLTRAIELNAVAIENNKTAFAWGRRAAHDLPSVKKLFASAQVIAMPSSASRDSVDALVARRVEFLTAYQNAAYAQSYEAFVRKVEQAEAVLGKTLLSQNVARYLFKLMSYKDEYEVARLHTDTAFLNKVNAMFEGDFKLNYHLAPPLIAKTNDKGELQKQKFGPWMLTSFKLLARLKGLRGTALDPFGRTAERKMERQLVVDYKASIEALLKSLTFESHAVAVDIARVPEMIKGYGHVKDRNVKAARLQSATLAQRFAAPATTGEKRAA